MTTKKNSKKNTKKVNSNKIVLLGSLVFVVGALLVLSLFNDPTQNFNFENDGSLKQFSSQEELVDFLEANSDNGGYSPYMTKALSSRMDMAVNELSAVADTAESVGSSNDGSSDYSETNNQIEGVDEADIVKTDGDYIYYTENNIVYIVKANPAEELEVLAELEIEDVWPQELFIDEDKLIVIGNERFTPKNNDDEKPSPMAKVASSISSIMPFPRYESHSFVKIYDISDKKNPELKESISYEGNYFAARKINNYVYVVFNKYMYNDFQPPIIYYRGGQMEITADKISYFDTPDSSYSLTTVMAIDLDDNKFEEETILKGASQNVFVSEGNIYLTSRKYIPYYYEQKVMYEEVLKDQLPSDVVEKIEKIENYDIRESTKIQEMEYVVQKYLSSLDEDESEEFQNNIEDKVEKIQKRIQEMRDQTIISKISIDEMDIDFVGTNEVPGYVLNQFSMDEHNGYFRIATTKGNMWDEENPATNNVYVLDEDLEIIGKLEDLAPQERIYSARFMGDKAYLVTFKNIDPLFVIDLENPENPSVLGKLKIPGFSNYLHPVGDNILLGIGKETVESSDKDSERTYQTGVKISLFDVSDLEKPKELSKLIIGDRGSSTPADYDHKAVLFDKRNNLLVVPISVSEIDPEKYPKGVDEWSYGEHVFQGAYVIEVTEDDLDQVGRITHYEDEDFEKSGYYYRYDKSIQRSLYINDVIYTLSQSKIKANTLSDLEEVSEVVLKETKEIKDDIIYYDDVAEIAIN